VLRRLEFVAEVSGPLPVVGVVTGHTWIARHNRKLPSEREWALKSRSRNRNPLDELEQTPNSLRHPQPGENATTTWHFL
jgi:hypothetical protein